VGGIDRQHDNRDVATGLSNTRAAASGLSPMTRFASSTGTYTGTYGNGVRSMRSEPPAARSAACATAEIVRRVDSMVSPA